MKKALDESSLVLHDDEDIEFAQKLLDQRSGTNANELPSKGGAKLNYFRGTPEEEYRLEAYYQSQCKLTSAWKVRKLANLGQAEWRPELYVAEVIKQGKFMQTKCHYHHKGFFALYPEEALFLLDVGEIELTYKGAMLSMQDAYSLLLADSYGSNLCSIDEYLVYAHLSRIGYRVQRFSADTTRSLETNKSTNDTIVAKHEMSEDECTLSEEKEVKRIKLFSSGGSSQLSLSQIDYQPKLLHREWWITSAEDKDLLNHISFPECHHTPNQLATFPNFYDRKSNIVLKQQSMLFIPRQTTSYDCEVPRIWQERIHREDSHVKTTSRDDYSHPRSIDYQKLCRTAGNWGHFKRLVNEELIVKSNEMKWLHEIMWSGLEKPLLHCTDALNTQAILDKLNVCEATSTLKHDRTNSFVHTIRFNVYQTENMKAFRKTQPGKPFLRVVVTNPSVPIPTLNDITEIGVQSDGVPVKIAFVDSSKVLFFAFDSIQIPTDIVLG
ncbi:unnamed protein product [Clavelina lepadiformis]|uniref:tRNA-splicing endonuclease subunit Sen54 N-terminal domain-containing protein n=1 Tax=Clavelina lepadiformis TaxID=159417 RepID=A0ABP0F863_CLALP